MLNFTKMLMFSLVIGIMTTGVAFTAVDQNKGAPKMVLLGGKLGNVSFPHHRHQTAFNDCNKCHNIFPQTAGSIQELKKQGKLKKKQVMNQCRDCHKKMTQAGKKTGPTQCKACHQKK